MKVGLRPTGPIDGFCFMPSAGIENHVLCDSDSLLRELRVLASSCSPIRRMTVSATYFLNRAMTIAANLSPKGHPSHS